MAAWTTTNLPFAIRYIHWIARSPAHNSPNPVNVRCFNSLFNSAHPGADYLTKINPESEEDFPNAMIEVGFSEIKRRAPWAAN